MKKFVVYTVMTGGYNDLLQPLTIDDRFDYVLFSNDFEVNTIGVWQVRPIPDVVDLDDNKRLSRYPKCHPEEMLNEYEVSLYIDANIQIAENGIYDRIVSLYNTGDVYAGIKLNISPRDCIYDHALDMSMMGVEHDYIAIRQCHELYKRGFPRHYGLNENNVIYRKHCEEMRKVDEEWWWWITNYSFRDQFSFMYCLWKYKIENTYLLPEYQDTRTSPYFNFIEHNSRRIVNKRKFIRKGIFEKWRIASYSYINDLTEKWYTIIAKESPEKALRIFGIRNSIRYTPMICFDYVISSIQKIRNRIYK